MGRSKGEKDQRVHRGIVNHENFECNMYMLEQETTEFECANPKQ
jgi:hypothetical protein